MKIDFTEAVRFLEAVGFNVVGLSQVGLKLEIEVPRSVQTKYAIGQVIDVYMMACAQTELGYDLLFTFLPRKPKQVFAITLMVEGGRTFNWFRLFSPSPKVIIEELALFMTMLATNRLHKCWPYYKEVMAPIFLTNWRKFGGDLPSENLPDPSYLIVSGDELCVNCGGVVATTT